MPATSPATTPPTAGESSFLFFTCQPGAETPLKREIAARYPAWRLAFSRPGFVSFKGLQQQVAAALSGPLPVFARSRSAALGQVREANLTQAVQSVLQLPALQGWRKQHGPDHALQALHVWQRDELLPGENGFEPHVTPLADEVRQALLSEFTQHDTDAPLGKGSSPVAAQGASVLDLLLVEPAIWQLGWHYASSRTERWPGGMLPIAHDNEPISRAYYKLQEALKWSALPTKAGEQWIDLGCAPGGASQALLERGFQVLGVDPAEVDPRLADHPQFEHLRKRSADVRRAEFSAAHWLAADLNVAPQYTLDAVEPIVEHSSTSIRGLVLTLKLANWELATPEQLAQYTSRVQSWGYRDVRLRQLVHNRREICLVALRSRAQRRVRR